MKQTIELLAPAGNLERMKVAIAYGADAVYAGADAFSLRARAKNFDIDALKEGIDYAHRHDKKFYLTTNIFLHNRDIAPFRNFLCEIKELAPDALIISDPGAFTLAKTYAPNIPIHVSTQANNTNWETVRFWHNFGAQRVVLARELSLAEAKEIRENIPVDMELEAFVHGAMCISYSGRCLLSAFMTGRESNRGDCAHPCRWNYTLTEEKRPNEHYPIFEDERGSYIFNARDMCMIRHIPELIDAGITSFKIEGRVKTEYYVATVVSAYRAAIDNYLKDPKKYCFQKEWEDELQKVSNRGYTTGFWLGKPDNSAQEYLTGSYIQNYSVCGIAGKTDDRGTRFMQKNKLSVGDVVEIMVPQQGFQTTTVTGLYDENGTEISAAPHPQQVFYLKTAKTYPEYTMIRKRNEE